MRFSHFIRPSLVAALVLATMAYALLGPGAGQTSSDLLTALLHPGTEGFAPTVVWQWRAPRVVAALIVGMCLGISGALFQVLTHNPLGAQGLIACVLGLFLRGWCDVLTLGETPAATLGLDVNRARVAMVCIGTVLIALSTALVGPISFIALAAPHIARMISRTARTPLLLSGVIGALFLLVADTAGQRLFSPITLPAGLITVCAGGIYLVGLLLWQSRSTSAKGR